NTIYSMPLCGSAMYNDSIINGGNINVRTEFHSIAGYSLGNNKILRIPFGRNVSFNNTAIYVGNCSEIIVENGGTLQLDNVKIIGCGDWKGIKVRQHGILFMEDCRVQ